MENVISSIKRNHNEKYTMFCENFVYYISQGCDMEKAITMALDDTFYERRSRQRIEDPLTKRSRLQKMRLRKYARSQYHAPITWVQKHVNAFYATHQF